MSASNKEPPQPRRWLAKQREKPHKPLRQQPSAPQKRPVGPLKRPPAAIPFSDSNRPAPTPFSKPAHRLKPAPPLRGNKPNWHSKGPPTSQPRPPQPPRNKLGNWQRKPVKPSGLHRPNHENQWGGLPETHPFPRASEYPFLRSTVSASTSVPTGPSTTGRCLGNKGKPIGYWAKAVVVNQPWDAR